MVEVKTTSMRARSDDTGPRNAPTSVRGRPGDLSAEAEWLLTAASVYRAPVPADALLFSAGALTGAAAGAVLPGRGPDRLGELIGECAAAGLLTLDTASQPAIVRVAAEVAADLRAHLAAVGRSGAIAQAHRRAANYWQWRVTALRQDWESDVHDLLEARHHLIEADDLEPAETITEEVCSRLHAFDAFAQEEALIADTLARVPRHSARRPAWAYRLGKACHLQADYAAAGRWFAQALSGFDQLADTHGMASCLGYLGALAHARGDYAEAERCYLRSQVLEQAPAASRPAVPRPAVSHRVAGRGAGRRLARSIAGRARDRRSLVV